MFSEIRNWAYGTAFAALACAAAPAALADGFTSKISIDVAHPLADANPLILGNNVQWVDRGDELLQSDGRFSEPMLLKVKELAPTILRYPGGSLSDLYHWKDGLGDMGRRGSNEHFHTGRKQRVEMGLQEFLELCEEVGAQPLFTVNTASGTPEEAAEWVKRVNVEGLRSRRTGRMLSKARYWEIGNEPYLKEDDQKKLWVTPELFAARANRFIVAMKRADPGIEVGIPLRSDQISGLPATPYPGYNSKVLKSVTAPFEFVAMHNAYLPLGYDRSYGDDDLYWSSVAASRVVDSDFAETRRLLRALQPGRNIRLAVTEFNALFSLGKASDNYINSPAAALYVADLLRLFAYTPDLAFANFWSLSGNWHFGALGQRAQKRPAYEVLKAYRGVLKGKMLPVEIVTEMVDTPKVGYVAAQKLVPKLTGLATLEDDTVRVLLVNRDPARSSTTSISLSDGRNISAVRVVAWRARNRFDTQDGEGRFVREEKAVSIGSGPTSIEVAPLSFAVIELRGGGNAVSSGKKKRGAQQ